MKNHEEPDEIAAKIIESEEGRSDLKGFLKLLVFIIGILLSLFQIYVGAFGVMTPHLLRDVHLTLIMFLAFLLFPFRRGKSSRLDLGINTLCLIVTFVIGAYLFIEYEKIVFRAGAPANLDFVLGIAALVVVLEASRRTIGWPLPIVAIVFLFYAYMGPYLPGQLAHKGYDIQRIASFMYTSMEGIYGVAIGVSASFVFLFILLGSFLEKNGGGQFIIDSAYSLAGRSQGGPAKVAVISSGLFGTISGSSVANVVGTGTFTIPLMKKTGYSPVFAGAVEAVASTGGQIMPPVMGAAAFVMAEVIGTPYLSVCIAAAIPAVLFYVAVFSGVHFEAGRLGLLGLNASQLPDFKKLFKQKFQLLLPIPVLAAFMVMGYSPERCAVVAIVAAFVSSLFLRDTRMGLFKLAETLQDGARKAVGVAMACAAAGIVIGVTTLTGLGFKFSGIIVDLAGGNVLLLLILIMIAAIILGMGLPSVAGYIMLATLATPALIKMGIPPMVAHLYTFYFAISSNITPPVALAAYAAAGIARANPMSVGFAACRIGLAAFIIPYMMVYGPALTMIGTPIEILLACVSATIGCICLAGFSVGHFYRRNLDVFERVMLLAAAILLIKPGYVTDLIGILLLFLILLKVRRRSVSSHLSA